MTRNERLTQISSEAFLLLCEIADRHRIGRSQFTTDGSVKWWCVLYPAIHIPNRESFSTGTCFGLTFPVCDVSTLPVYLGPKFTFTTRESAEAFGYEAKDLLVDFFFPELTLTPQMVRTR